MMRDEEFMRDAIALAARAKGNTGPNPMVGAVVVAPDGAVVGSGYHERAGAAHAEALAIERAGARARGATLFVTLEPCHIEGRTPPCTEAIVTAGIARVVVAMLDPDPRERGQGVERLRDAGIDVEIGPCGDEANHLNRMYACHRNYGRPYVTLKMAQSVDGAIGERPGERRRLTGAIADRYVRSLRYEHDAVMVGIGTALADDPLLTVRPYRHRAVPYSRVIVDSTARLAIGSKLVGDLSRATTFVAVTDAAPVARVGALAEAGVRVIACEQDSQGRVRLADLMRRLGDLQMLGVLCEGGPRLASALLDDDLADELHWIIAPLVLGTAAIAPVLAGARKPTAIDVRSVRRLGDDVLIVGTPKRRSVEERITGSL
jgi:diaminohydroxyphosphoribosylaminopyrimidine deaminase/5-amino-6-(5-phosphoribosylamino)uracil reductase